jgi:biopolymer transport protein ExbD
VRTKLHQDHEPADLDITAFMNLMIVLVPVLLMSMVFSHIAVLQLRLPDSVEKALQDTPPEKQQIELEILPTAFNLYFPAGQLVNSYPRQETAPQPDPLVADLKAIKQRLLNLGIDKKDIVLMPTAQTDYQTIISTMDRVRFFQAVVAADVVAAELFPDISFADAQSTETVASSQAAQLQQNTGLAQGGVE